MKEKELLHALSCPCKNTSCRENQINVIKQQTLFVISEYSGLKTQWLLQRQRIVGSSLKELNLK